MVSKDYYRSLIAKTSNNVFAVKKNFAKHINVGLYWRRINISKLATKEDIDRAKKSTEQQSEGILSGLPFTENNYEWTLLHKHIETGQITPWAMRNMRRKDLYYIAGLSFPHPSLMIADKDKAPNKMPFFTLSGPYIDESETEEKRWERLTKIQGNAARAREEIKFRNFFWATFCVILAAVIGSFSAWTLSSFTSVLLK